MNFLKLILSKLTGQFHLDPVINNRVIKSGNCTLTSTMTLCVEMSFWY